MSRSDYPPKRGYCIGNGDYGPGTTHHSVVIKDGRFVWDPACELRDVGCPTRLFSFIHLIEIAPLVDEN